MDGVHGWGLRLASPEYESDQDRASGFALREREYLEVLGTGDIRHMALVGRKEFIVASLEYGSDRS